MEGLRHWAAMGGYAVWVWSAYGAAAIVLVGLLLASLASLRRREAEIERTEGRRRSVDRGASQ